MRMRGCLSPGTRGVKGESGACNLELLDSGNGSLKSNPEAPSVAFLPVRIQEPLGVVLIRLSYVREQESVNTHLGLPKINCYKVTV